MKGASMKRSGDRMKRADSGYVLIEVLLAMTVFAIAGSAVMMTLQNVVEASRNARDMSKAIYLTQAKLHEFKAEYNRRDNATTGEFRGEFPYPGTEDFRWRTYVEYDRQRDAYVITVITQWGEERNNRRGYYRDLGGANYMLRSFVPTARYNRDLMFGVAPVARVNMEMGQRGQRAQRQRGGRGSRGGRR